MSRYGDAEQAACVTHVTEVGVYKRFFEKKTRFRPRNKLRFKKKERKHGFDQEKRQKTGFRSRQEEYGGNLFGEENILTIEKKSKKQRSRPKKQ